MMPHSHYRPKGDFRRDHGIGGYIPGAQNSGGTAQRGGSYGDGINTGIYALALDLQADRAHSVTGFRCVYRPASNDPLSPATVVPTETQPVSQASGMIQPVIQ
jgi:hypothetical protein